MQLSKMKINSIKYERYTDIENVGNKESCSFVQEGEAGLRAISEAQDVVICHNARAQEAQEGLWRR